MWTTPLHSYLFANVFPVPYKFCCMYTWSILRREIYCIAMCQCILRKYSVHLSRSRKPLIALDWRINHSNRCHVLLWICPHSFQWLKCISLPRKFRNYEENSTSYTAKCFLVYRWTRIVSINIVYFPLNVRYRIEFWIPNLRSLPLDLVSWRMQ